MYTCKECLDYGIENKCPYPDSAKEDKLNQEDDDSFAFYCEGFRGCETHSVIHRGLVVTQSSSFAVWVNDYESGELRMHALVTEYLSDDKLIEYADFVIDELPKLQTMFSSEVKDE